MSENNVVQVPMMRYDDPFYTVTRLLRGLDFLTAALLERMVVEGGHVEPVGMIFTVAGQMNDTLKIIEQALRDRKFLLNENKIPFLTWDFDAEDAVNWRFEVEAMMEVRRRSHIQRNPVPVNKRAVQGLGGPGKTAAEIASGKAAKHVENVQAKRDINMSHQKGKTGEVKAAPGGKKRK